MTSTFELIKHILTAVVFLGLLSSWGCFKDDEQRASDAYRDYDFETAREYALTLVEQRNTFGFELLALMAVQGLGRSADVAEAYALAERALAIDPTYSELRLKIDKHVEDSLGAAEEAFDLAEYDRALTLVTPASEYGDSRALGLVEDLMLGQYVAFEGSELSWRDFWRECSGNTRFDTPSEAIQIFNHKCAGRSIIWDGVVTRSTADSAMIKMKPGRARVRHDIVLKLANEPDRSLFRGRKKLRFTAVVESRGDDSRPDHLTDGLIIGLAPLTRLEKASLPDFEKQDVMSACQKLALAKLEANHMPEWSSNLSEAIKEVSARGRNFFIYAGITSEQDVFKLGEDGAWEARFEGQFTVHSIAARLGTSSDFIADCVIDGTRDPEKPLENYGSVTVVSVSEVREVRQR